MARTTPVACLMLVLGLNLPDSLGAQDIARLQSGVVKIRAKPAEGGSKVGTGFIVRLEKDVAYIVTSTHVVAGDSDPTVEFFTKKNLSVPAEVLGLEGGDEIRGLALLVVKGDLPNGLAALPLASAIPSAEGMDIMVIGFPRSQGPWAVAKGNISSRQGRDLYFSPAVDEGYSGGPIIQNGRAIGLVGGTSQTVGRGVTARSVQDYIEGFGITAQESTASGTAEKTQEPAPPTVAKGFPTPSVPIQPERREAAPDRELTGKDGAPMVLVPAGEFMMGSPGSQGEKDEHPQHRVYLDAYYMDKFEVTVGLYAEFVRSTNRRKKPDYWNQVDSSKHGNLPVVGVDWHDADAYCRWHGIRLPTEAEWEKAARGTDSRTYPWGNEQPTASRANYGKGFSLTAYDGGLAPVGSYQADKSPYGVYDLAGNVWEWTADWYDENYYGQNASRNPQGPSSGSLKVLRGGSWSLEPFSVQSAYRVRASPTYRSATGGFRCAQDAPQSDQSR